MATISENIWETQDTQGAQESWHMSQEPELDRCFCMEGKPKLLKANLSKLLHIIVSGYNELRTKRNVRFPPRGPIWPTFLSGCC